MNIPTPQSLRRQLQPLDRRQRPVEAAIARMRGGCALHYGGGSYWLSDGTAISAAVAAAIIVRPDIVDVGDALPFPGARSQTFRFSE